jgi:hypothetical protein
VSLGVESSKNGPFQGTVGVGRHADVCDGLIHMPLALQWGSVASTPPAAIFLLGNGRPAVDKQPHWKLENLHKNKFLRQLVV